MMTGKTNSSPSLRNLAWNGARCSCTRVPRHGSVRVESLEARTCFDAVGPDGFGYRAEPAAVENINLALGAAGVFSIVSGDDEVAALDLGANSFEFYGRTYSDDELFVSTNGLITFLTPNGATYDDLPSELPEAAIAPLLGDWVTSVLGKFEDTNGDSTADRLIIEWDGYPYEPPIWDDPWYEYDDPYAFRTYSSISNPSDTMTAFPHIEEPSDLWFQAILELNTGGAPGAITLNYRNVLYYGSAHRWVVGIKAEGVQGDDYLPMSSGGGRMESHATRVSADFAALADDGTLNVRGTGAADSVGFSVRGSELRVTRNGETRAFPASDVTNVQVRSFGGDDVIDWSGIPIPANVDAGAGDDLVLGGAGDDTVSGGDGADRIGGGDGHDTLAGNAQADRIDGGNGNDFLNGHGGRDKLAGGGGNDVIYGGASGDFLAGQGGDDSIRGDGGNDRIYGGVGGRDTLRGNAGDDLFASNDGFIDELFGDGGTDTAAADVGDLLTSVEQLLA